MFCYFGDIIHLFTGYEDNSYFFLETQGKYNARITSNKTIEIKFSARDAFLE